MKLKYFFADWCVPCKVMKPIVSEIENEGYEVERINVEDNPETAEKYRVAGLPTFLVEDSGVEVGREVGSTSKESILNLLT